jgi:pyruvate formate lyase activating enzyme
VRACPRNLRRFAATEYTDEQLAARILGNQDFLLKYGGVTFSGGEPLAQPDFLFDVMSGIKPLDIAVETSGYACPEVFGEMLKLADLVLLDIKHIDDKIHKEYTGVSNEPVMRSLEMLQQSGMPFEIRVPVIPGVNDGIDNIRATAALVKDSKALVRVELLAYHRTAGAKYGLVDREFTFRYDQEPTDISVLAAIVESEGVPVFVP